MIRRRPAGYFGLLLAGSGWAQGSPTTAEPTRDNLPIRVTVGLYVVKIEEIREAQGSFSATCDMRLAWQDSRLAFDAKQAGVGRREFGGRRALAQLSQMWDPGIKLSNLRGAAIADQVVDQTLWIDAQGRVEWIRRLRGEFDAHFDSANFPVDDQWLSFNFLAADYNRHSVLLGTDQASQQFSQGVTPTLPGWRLGRTVFSSDFVSHWNGSTHSTVLGQLPASRQAAPYIAPIFTPLMATLLVPMLAIWLNRWKDNGFQVEPFELMNITVGGLFATIALTLAIYSSYPFLSSGNNVVGRLFTLNFVMLALATIVILGLFKTQISERPFLSPYVAREIYRAISWLMPVVTLVAVLALFLSALP